VADDRVTASTLLIAIMQTAASFGTVPRALSRATADLVRPAALLILWQSGCWQRWAVRVCGPGSASSRSYLLRDTFCLNIGRAMKQSRVAGDSPLNWCAFGVAGRDLPLNSAGSSGHVLVGPVWRVAGGHASRRHKEKQWFSS